MALSSISAAAPQALRILKDGKVISVDDEPSGGTHLSLVIAGAKGIEFLKAEKLKKDPAEHKELMPIVRPVFEKDGQYHRQFHRRI